MIGAMQTDAPPIKGYRTLTPDEVALINRGKELAEEVGAWVADLQATATLDKRWLAIGATQLQQGFMAVTRGIARPTTF